MPKINFNGTETPDTMPMAPTGVPVDFEVASMELGESKTGKEMYTVQLKIKGTEADGESIYHYFVEPSSNRKTQIAINRFAKAIGVAVGVDGVDSEEFIGKSGKMVLKGDTYEGRETRKVNDFLLLKA